jgi:preprotein translocase subunit SecG
MQNSTDTEDWLILIFIFSAIFLFLLYMSKKNGGKLSKLRKREKPIKK